MAVPETAVCGETFREGPLNGDRPWWALRFGFIDIRNERWIDALPELWRLLTRKPPRSKPWRDFWKLWLPAFAIVFGVFAILDLSPFSPLGFVLLIALAVGVSYVTGVLFRRLGVIGDYRTRR